MIIFKDISKKFNGKAVLHNLSGTFWPGKINLIIGNSGTGKSVLIKCIVGLVKPEVGSVYYNQRRFRPTESGPVERAVRREIGMLFQSSALFDSKNVEENVRFPLDILTHMTKKEKLHRVHFCLERVGLTDAHKKMPSELSGGMKKRVGLARAIVNQSKYLFCDEPNSGLDPQSAIRIDKLIEEITHEYQITTVVVTHDMNSVVGIGSHIIFLHKGEKRWEGSREEILKASEKHLQEFIFSNQLMRALK